MVQLKPVTKDNLEEVLALQTFERQQSFVSSPAVALSQAYVYGDTAFPFAVYDGETPVGFIMMGYYEAKQYYTLWKFLIDKKYQHKGYGREALRLGIAFLQDRFRAKEVYTGVLPDNTAARSLYRSAGFAETGLVENGMIEMRLQL